MFESYVIFASTKAILLNWIAYRQFESYVIFASTKAMPYNFDCPK